MPSALENPSWLQAVIMDKTGTLTKGAPYVAGQNEWHGHC